MILLPQTDVILISPKPPDSIYRIIHFITQNTLTKLTKPTIIHSVFGENKSTVLMDVEGFWLCSLFSFAASLTAASLTAASLTATSLTAASLTAASLTAASLTAASLMAGSLTAASLTAASLMAASLSLLSSHLHVQLAALWIHFHQSRVRLCGYGFDGLVLSSVGPLLEGLFL